MKKTFWQKAISVCLALLMIPALIPAQLVISASAADAIPYIYRYWDGVNVVSETKQCESYTNVNGISSYLSGWYVINSSVSIENRLTVYGTANLILCDGVKLYLYNGINVSYGNTLNIYCQSGGSGGTVTIYGGTVKATGGKYGAGIGGGDNDHKNTNGGTVIIYGGNVTATGGNRKRRGRNR